MPGERAAFSANFVSACRRKELDAIAVTDHHDLAFFPLIRDAAAHQRGENGEPLPQEKRLIVFPGLELTVAVPCQALVLFDPDIDDKSLSGAMGALGIEQSPASDPKTAETRKLRFNDLQEITEALDALTSVKGRYILLPNVNDGGSDTILRHDFSEHYRRMPCVGGYVDGSASNHRKTLILDGRDPAWGRKAIGVIQTSDGRDAEFAALGTHSTWIKWSHPSAEAIRQACLSPDSRLCYAPPLTPDSWIASMEVSDSKYFGGFALQFNPQLNTIIGGRGTGKSTILEYLRWALCDQAYVHSTEDGSELPNYEKRRRALVTGTLEPTHGTVTIEYIQHGVSHRIRREAGTNRVYLKIGDGAEAETTEEAIRNLAQIQGYSQKQLSHVSIRAQEIERLLTAPIAQELSNLETEKRDRASTLRQIFESRESRLNIEEQLRTVTIELTSKGEQVATLQNQIKDLPLEHRQHIDGHPAFSQGERLLREFTAAIDNAESIIGVTGTTLQQRLNSLPDTATSQPSAELTTIRRVVANSLGQIVNQLNEISETIRAARGNIQNQLRAASGLIENHKTSYAAATSESQVVQERLDALRSLSDEIAKSEGDREALTTRGAEIGDVDGALQNARDGWLAAIRRKRELLEGQASSLRRDSDDQLRVQIGGPQNAQELREAIQVAIAGASMTRPEKIDYIVKEVVDSRDPVAAWLELTGEMVELARVGPRLDSGAPLPSTPRLKRGSFTDAELARISRRLKITPAFELTLLHPDAAPEFFYRVTQTEYAPFDQASPGQQATALIGLLLNQSAGALVVDQPEDDLDNLTIMQVAARLWEAKKKRQIIFTTHNPNLVVIGDAENVAHCAYGLPSTPAKLRIASQGAIDDPAICHVITEVMEGGKEAFSLRKEKYGF